MIKIYLLKLLQSFQRQTKSTKFIPEIDALRFFAIMPVLLAHSKVHFIKIFQHEDELPIGIFSKALFYHDYGVILFFFISGFILSFPFAKHSYEKISDVNLKAYYLRRLKRIEPPYLIAVSVFLLVHIILLNQNFKAYLEHYFFTIIYGHHFYYGYRSPILPVAWSLEIEIQFYLIAPFLSVFFFRSKHPHIRLTKVFVVLVPFLLAITLIPDYQNLLEVFHLDRSILWYLQFFLFGYIASILFSNYNSFFNKKSYLWDFIIIVNFFILYAYVWGQNWTLEKNIEILIIFLLLFTAAFKGILFNKVCRSQIIVVIGGMCYSIYLIHYPLIFLLGKFLNRINFGNNIEVSLWLYTITNISIILIASAIFYKLFEQPFMNKRTSKSTSPALKSYKEGKVLNQGQ